MDLHLSNKKVVVTGASRGLGWAVANRFALEKANVLINSRSQTHLDQAAQQIHENSAQKVRTHAGNVSDAGYAAKLRDEIKNTFGSLDILVSNAGGPKPGRFENFSDQDWYEAIDLSMMSHIRLIRECLPLLRLSSSPSVLTITSYSAKQPIPNLVLSNVLRAAAVGLTKTLALELGSESIRFNSILPGWTKTERVSSLLNDRSKTNQTSFSTEMEKLTHEIPLSRMAEPEEFANVAVFLASPAASYLTGIMLTVDGGIVKSIF
jgi:3-oxoacyl-[acyl-carrier protein] reductase